MTDTNNTVVYTVQAHFFVSNFLQKYAKEHGYKSTNGKIEWNSAFAEIEAKHSDVIKGEKGFNNLRPGTQIKFAQSEMDDIMHKMGMSKPASAQVAQLEKPATVQPKPSATPKPNTLNTSVSTVIPPKIAPQTAKNVPTPKKPAPVSHPIHPPRPVIAHMQASTLSVIKAKQEAVENEYKKLVAVEWKKAAGETLTGAEKALWEKYNSESTARHDYIGVGGLVASWFVKNNKILSSHNSERQALCDRLGYLTQKRIELEQVQIKQLAQQGKTQEAEALNNDIKRLQYNQQHLDDIPANIASSTDFRQGQIGDCWFLGSLRALTYTQYGLNIIKQSVIRENNGNVTVKLRGINKSYTFTPKDIQEYTNLYPFSNGNDDVKMLEMAILRELNHSNSPILDVLNPDPQNRGFRDSTLPGGHSQIATKDGRIFISAFKLLTGEDNDNIYIGKTGDKKIDVFSDDGFYKKTNKELNNQLASMQKYPNRYAAVVCFANSDELVNMHQYAIKRVNNDCIIVVNPWNTSEEIKISKEYLIKHYVRAQIFDTWDKNGSNYKYAHDGSIYV